MAFGEWWIGPGLGGGWWRFHLGLEQAEQWRHEMIYGVWIWNAGKWHLSSTWTRKAEADVECAYLRDMCGIDAHVFVKL